MPKQAKDDIRTPLANVLAAYKRKCGTGSRGAIRDAIAQLAHLAEDADLPVNDVVVEGISLYAEETAETDGSSTLGFLRALDAAAKAIRERLKIHRPDEQLYCEVNGNETIVVEADGFGGASLRVFDDDSPYFREQGVVIREQSFDSEEAACEAADKDAEDDE
jgi:hypothetical protein